MDYKEIINVALQLKPIEKLHLIEKLSESLNAADSEIEKAWAEEAEKRVNAFLEGKVKTTPFNEVKTKHK